jgi:hypothetical protein
VKEQRHVAEVKVELEDGSMLVISGQRNCEKEDKGDRWHHGRAAAAGSRGGSGCRTTPRWTR